MKRSKIVASIILVFFAILYCSISLVNHYLLRTYALDLGLFNNALYDYAHLKANMFTLSAHSPPVNYFGVHFSPITIIYAPFYYLFGSYTLLIIQIASILIGGLGIKKLAELYFINRYTPILFMLYFFCTWGIFSALAFDFHNNVIAAMMVPWFVLFWKKEDWWRLVIVFLLILITKENMALWIGFIIASLLIGETKVKSKRWLPLKTSLLITAFIYFIVVIKVIMPHFAMEESNIQLTRYGHLGSSLSGITEYLVTHPWESVKILFTNQLPNADYNWIKIEFNVMLLLSGGFALLLRPVYLIMLIPIYLQNFLSTQVTMWGINYQYSIEVVPVLSMAVISLASAKVKRGMPQNLFVGAIATVTALATLTSMNGMRSIAYNKTNTKPFFRLHYQSKLDVGAIKSGLELIPENAAVSTNSTLAPHVAFRDSLYIFPDIKNAQYIALIKKPRTIYDSYPVTPEEIRERISNMKVNPKYSIFEESKQLIILKRIKRRKINNP